MSSDRWVRIHTTENIFETDTIRDALDTEGIEYVVKEYKDTAYDGLFVLQKGCAAVFTQEEDEASAKAIIKRVKDIPYVAVSED
jgi:hypothetical protein